MSKFIEAAMYFQNTEYQRWGKLATLKLDKLLGKGSKLSNQKSRISYFLDTLLKPYFKNIKSYIRESVYVLIIVLEK